MREIRTLRATWRGLETWHGRDSGTLADERRDNREPKLRPKPARQSSTLPMSEVWKRSHGRTNKAPPDERGGNRYVRPKATAPHLDSTKRYRSPSAIVQGQVRRGLKADLIPTPWPKAHALPSL